MTTQTHHKGLSLHWRVLCVAAMPVFTARTLFLMWRESFNKDPRIAYAWRSYFWRTHVEHMRILWDCFWIGV